MLKATCKECGAWIQVETVGARHHEITLNMSHILCSVEQSRQGREQPDFDYSTCPSMVGALNECLSEQTAAVLSQTA
jgi:hypothetical protein